MEASKRRFSSVVNSVLLHERFFLQVHHQYCRSAEGTGTCLILDSNIISKDIAKYE